MKKIINFKRGFILPFALCVAITGYSKAEEYTVQPSANEIEYNQTFAFAEALSCMPKIRESLVNDFSKKGKCSDYEFTSDSFSYTDAVYITKNCEIKFTFNKNIYIPDLNGQTLTLKMTVDKDDFIWSCSFSGKNNIVPPFCQTK